MSEKDLKYINGISGKVFEGKITDLHFCLNFEGEERKDDTSGILFVYPKEIGETIPGRKSIQQLLSKPSQKVFSISEDESFSEICSIKNQENTYINNFFNLSKKQVDKSEECSKEFDYQCKSLKALSRNTQNIILDNFRVFVISCKKLYEKFVEVKKGLKKNTEKIYTDMIIKDINSKITPKKVKSLFDFVVLDDLNNDERKMVNQLFANVVKYQEYVSSRINGWETLLKCYEKKFSKMNESPNYSKLITNENKSSYDEFRNFKENINKNVESIKSIALKHEVHFLKLKDQKSINVSTLGILNEMNAFDYLDKINGLDESITTDLFKCIDHKYKNDEIFFEFFKEILVVRKNMRNIIKLNEKNIKILTENVILTSLKKLIFAQNLPEVYENSINELLRRNKFVSELRKKILKINNKLLLNCNEENTKRKAFLKDQEKKLGFKIPSDLIVGIYDLIKIPTGDIYKIDPNLPDISLVSQEIDNIENQFEIIDDFETDVKPAVLPKGGIDPSLIGTIMERETFKKDQILQKGMSTLMKDIEQNFKEPTPSKVVEEKKSVVDDDLTKAKKNVENLNKKFENLNQNYSRLQTVNEFLKKDKKEEIDKLKGENNEMIDDLTSQVEKVVKEKGEMENKIAELEKELKKKILQNASKNTETQQNFKVELNKAWGVKEKLEKEVKALKTGMDVKDVNIKDLKNELKKILMTNVDEKKQQGKVLAEKTKEIDNLNKLVNQVLEQNDKQKVENAKFVKTIKNSAKIIENLKGHEKKCKKLESDVEKIMKKKLNLQSVIQKQVTLIEDTTKMNEHLKKENELLKSGKLKHKYEMQLQALHDMGLIDREKNEKALFKFNGDVDKAVKFILEAENMEKQSRKDKRYVALFDFKLYDRVFFYKKNEKIWECLNFNCPNHFMSPFSVNSLKGMNKSAHACVGQIIEIVEVDNSKQNPLNLNHPYKLFLISIESAK